MNITITNRVTGATQTIDKSFGVSETLAINGYTHIMIVGKGFGSCRKNDEYFHFDYQY